MAIQWSGVYAATCTHYASDGAIDLAATLRHYDAMIDAGVHGLIPLGTVGENSSHEFREKVDFLTAVVKHVGGRVPVLVGVAEATTALACRFASAAQEAGADGLMVLPGMGYKADARETMAHFRSVARAVDLPIMVYNNPVTYGVDVTPEMFDEMSDEPRFVAIKESSENPRRITDIINRCGNRYTLFCGVDDLVLESVMLGATGWVSGLVNAFPAENRLLWDLLQSGNYEEALRVYRWYTPLLHLDTHVKLVQYIKLAVAECGYGSEAVRAPRLTLTGPERARVLDVIRQALATRPQRERVEMTAK